MKYFSVWLITCLVIITQSACFRNYYVTREKPSGNQHDFQAITDTTKKVFIHFNSHIMLAKNLMMQDSVLVGSLEAYPNYPADSLFPAFQTGPHAIRRKKIDMFCAQVHVFVQQPTAPSSGVLRLAPADILRIQTYQFDKKRSAASHTLGFVTVSAAIAGTIALFIAFTDSLISL